jgi:ribosomal protein L4
MANLNTLDLNNKPSGQIELNDQILETEYHPQAIKQAVVGFLAQIGRAPTLPKPAQKFHIVQKSSIGKKVRETLVQEVTNLLYVVTEE